MPRFFVTLVDLSKHLARAPFRQSRRILPWFPSIHGGTKTTNEVNKRGLDAARTLPEQCDPVVGRTIELSYTAIKIYDVGMNFSGITVLVVNGSDNLNFNLKTASILYVFQTGQETVLSVTVANG